MATSQVAGGDVITAAKLNEITVGSTAPSSPTTGWVWIDTTTAGSPVVKVYNGSSWITTSIAPSMLTAIGDLIYANSVGSAARLAIGSTDQVLSVSGGIPQWQTRVDATAPSTLAFAGAAAAGSSSVFARRDHSHGMPTVKLTGSGTGGHATNAVLTLSVGSYQGRYKRLRLQIGSGAGGGTGPTANTEVWMQVAGLTSGYYNQGIFYYHNGTAMTAQQARSDLNTTRSFLGRAGNTAGPIIFDIEIMDIGGNGAISIISNYHGLLNNYGRLGTFINANGTSNYADLIDIGWQGSSIAYAYQLLVI